MARVLGGLSLTSIAATCLWQRARAERSRRFVRLALFWLAVLARSNVARADLAIETETARVLAPGLYTAGAAFEFQTSPGGAEYAVPTAFEFGVFKNLELMVEPVAFTAILPRGGGSSYGLGDTEATLTYRFLEESPLIPALALGGEVKLPTASSLQIGSGEFDYRLLVIASKRIADVDLHLNVGYTFTGAPPGESTRNPLDLALAAEWFVTPKYDLFAEVTYVASSIPNSGGDAADTAPSVSNESLTTPELAGKEIVGSVGGRFHVTDHVDLFGSASYDNNHATLLRTGFNFRF